MDEGWRKKTRPDGVERLGRQVLKVKSGKREVMPLEEGNQGFFQKEGENSEPIDGRQKPQYADPP